MDYWLIIFVLTGALVYVVSAQTRLYTFVSTPLNWREAQSVCRQNYTDLATAESTADISAIIGTTSTYTDEAWIGLHDDLVNSWRWSLSDNSFYAEGETEFRNWNVSEPNNLGGSELCVQIRAGSTYFGVWNDENCSSQRQSVCYNGTLNDTASFVKVDTLSNWTEAQRFCRENYVDLASVRNQQENDIINFLSDGFFWIGLHREKQWSDGSTSLFRIWKIGQPSFIGEGCVSTAFNDSGLWSEQDCSLSLPFICYTTNTPPNTDTFKSIGQNETSITLQWNQVNTNVSFVLKFNGTERNISEPVNGPVIYTVSSLTPGTKYTFTLFSVFESVRSSGVNTAAVTGPYYVVGLKIRLKSLIQPSDLDIQDLLTTFLKRQGLPPQFSLKIHP